MTFKVIILNKYTARVWYETYNNEKKYRKRTKYVHKSRVLELVGVEIIH